MASNTKPSGLKSFTNPHSIPVRIAKGGKEYVKDTSKKRSYKVKGE